MGREGLQDGEGHVFEDVREPLEKYWKQCLNGVLASMMISVKTLSCIATSN